MDRFMILTFALLSYTPYAVVYTNTFRKQKTTNPIIPDMI